jgi:DNA end-binding protein Ku
VPQREGRERRRARIGARDEADRADSGAPVAHPIWSGSLSFGLVSVPVELYSAQRNAGVSLRMLSPDGTPLARQYVCPKEERPLDPDEIVRGFEVADGRFVVVSDEELEALAPRRTRDIELQQFVDRREIDPAYFVRTYYLVPAGEQTKAYRLLAEILEEKGLAGIASFVMRERAYPVAIFAESGILRAETLRFADEIRTPKTLGLPRAAKPDARRVRAIEKATSGLARRELATRELHDDEPHRLLALARKKRARGEDVVEVAEEPGSADERGAEVVDLVALLKERLGAARAPARHGARTSARSRRPRRGASRRARGR